MSVLCRHPQRQQQWQEEEEEGWKDLRSFLQRQQWRMGFSLTPMLQTTKTLTPRTHRAVCMAAERWRKRPTRAVLARRVEGGGGVTMMTMTMTTTTTTGTIAVGLAVQVTQRSRAVGEAALGALSPRVAVTAAAWRRRRWRQVRTVAMPPTLKTTLPARWWVAAVRMVLVVAAAATAAAASWRGMTSRNSWCFCYQATAAFDVARCSPTPFFFFYVPVILPPGI
mmetsp:Transcript_41127/g.82962  ORF Transcript_41127/g.82962 Transcript_41127/m.82962 type:complete len:224 (+) Transcript_41127:574-1245(+)